MIDTGVMYPPDREGNRAARHWAQHRGHIVMWRRSAQRFECTLCGETFFSIHDPFTGELVKVWGTNMNAVDVGCRMSQVCVLP